MHPAFRRLLDKELPRIASLELQKLPSAPLVVEDTPRTYSYTADYLHFLRCPRQYMIFRQFDFVPSRSQPMLFGTLVHRTMADLHQWLFARRTNGIASCREGGGQQGENTVG